MSVDLKSQRGKGTPIPHDAELPRQWHKMTREWFSHPDIEVFQWCSVAPPVYQTRAKGPFRLAH